MNTFAATLSLLERAGIAAGTEAELKHGFVSSDGRYCAVTLDNLQSFIVDLQRARYLHFPEASAAGFDGDTAILSPDEVRFNLMSWDEEVKVDLRDLSLGWHPVRAS